VTCSPSAREREREREREIRREREKEREKAVGQRKDQRNLISKLWEMRYF
jgi:hypothetical protein